MPLRVIPLGGLGEFGLNSLLYDDGDSAVLVAAGLMFPDDTMLGVDYVVPDFSVLRSTAPHLGALLLTLTDDTLAALGRYADIDPEPPLAVALSPEVQAQYAANTDEAVARSVFGSPTYFVDGDMFYGQDRLELVERALRRPFAGKWPR